MTDTEIIKALECCTTKGAKCSDCPAFKKVDRSDCKKYFRGAIDLIKSQKADTERHAHWIFQSETSSAFDKKYKCSKCNRVIVVFDEKDLIHYQYCHCGAKMDEVAGNE